jgi:hypothetical protein
MTGARCQQGHIRVSEQEDHRLRDDGPRRRRGLSAGVSYSAKGTNVGTYDGAFSGTPVIKVGDVDVTENYVITNKPSTLTITKADFNLTNTGAQATSKVYTGSEQEITDFTTDGTACRRCNLKRSELQREGQRMSGPTQASSADTPVDQSGRCRCDRELCDHKYTGCADNHEGKPCADEHRAQATARSIQAANRRSRTSRRRALSAEQP